MEQVRRHDRGAELDTLGDRRRRLDRRQGIDRPRKIGRPRARETQLLGFCRARLHLRDGGGRAPCLADEDPYAHLAPSTSSMAASSMSAASSTSCCVTDSGGAIRNTLPYSPPLPINNPRRLAASCRAATAAESGSIEPGTTVSSASIKPLPRNSAIHGERATTGASRLRRYSPRAKALA